MLNWIRRKLANRHRAIYRYWDGSKIRRADPMVLHRALVSHPDFNISEHPLLMDHDEEIRKIVFRAIRETFDVKPWDETTGQGLTEEETWNLYVAFVLYCNAKKKNVSPSPTSPTGTESKPPGPPMEEESDTIPFSASTSTSPAPKFDMPPVS